jgi:hypothetical protein
MEADNGSYTLRILIKYYNKKKAEKTTKQKGAKRKNPHGSKPEEKKGKMP